MTRVATSAALIAVLAGTAAEAGTTCTFTSECMIGEGCSETVFALEISIGEDADVTLITDFGDVEVQSLAEGEAATQYFGTGPGASYMLTHAAENIAALSVHFEDATQIFVYEGACEVADD